MKLPSDLFINSIAPRKIYYFKSDRLNTEVTHYFICLSRGDDQMVILVCSTSQFEKRKTFIESRNLPHSTLVWIEPTKENGFRVDSFVDCNSYFDYTIDELKNIYESNGLEYKGELSKSKFQEILIGLHDSPLIEDYIKDLIPKDEFDDD